MKKLALLMPGQGAQYIGMGKSVYERFDVAKKAFRDAGEVLGFDLAELCFEGDMKELTQTKNTQPAMLTVSYAAFQAYMEETEMEPFCSAGHSLGEISALTCAGAIDFKDAVAIARKRGTYMGEAISSGDGSMIAVVGMEKEKIEEMCQTYSTEERYACISNYNTESQIVISGHKDIVEMIGNGLEQQGGRIYRLKVSAPFHSPLMKPAAEKMKEVLAQYTFQLPKWTIISDVDAQPYKRASEIADKLACQIVKPVQWIQIMEYMKQAGVTHTLELGPGKTLTKFMKTSIPDNSAFVLDKDSDIEKLKQLSRECNLEFQKEAPEGRSIISKCLTIAATTRNYNFEEEAYEKGVIQPYRKIEKILQELGEKEPDKGQVEEAEQLLSLILKNKKLTEKQQEEKMCLLRTRV